MKVMIRTKRPAVPIIRMIRSESNPKVQYKVVGSNLNDATCACLGWTRHMPRRPCKHIRLVFGPRS